MRCTRHPRPTRNANSLPLLHQRQTVVLLTRRYPAISSTVKTSGSRVESVIASALSTQNRFNISGVAWGGRSPPQVPALHISANRHSTQGISGMIEDTAMGSDQRGRHLRPPSRISTDRSRKALESPGRIRKLLCQQSAAEYTGEHYRPQAEVQCTNRHLLHRILIVLARAPPPA